jgi:hypothetical protein
MYAESKLFGRKVMAAAITGSEGKLALEELQRMHRELEAFQNEMQPDDTQKIERAINTYTPRVQAFSQPLDKNRKEKRQALLRREYNACVDAVNTLAATLGLLRKHNSTIKTLRLSRCESQSRLIPDSDQEAPGTPKSRIDTKKDDSESNGGTPKSGHRPHHSLSLSRSRNHSNADAGDRSQPSTPKNGENGGRKFTYSVTALRPSLLAMAPEGPADDEEAPPPIPPALQKIPQTPPKQEPDEGTETELSVKEPDPRRLTVSTTQPPSQLQRHSNNSQDGAAEPSTETVQAQPSPPPTPPIDPVRVHLERLGTLPPKRCCAIL